jgi:acyl carrier protein
MDQHMVLDRVRWALRKVVPELEVHEQLDGDVEELGVSSVELLEVVALIEDTFGVSLPDDELAGIRRVEDLATLVWRQTRGEET